MAPRESSQWPLAALFGLCIARLWLVPLPSSFRVDELETVFVAAHPRHPSLGNALEAFESIYYYLPRAAHALTGSSETSYRLPSMLAMAIALGLIARLAARLIHPRAGWFAVFTCFMLRGIDYHAIDARPYALGIMVSAVAVFLLVRWLDSARWSDAALFALSAALVWRVHLVYWPFYIVMAVYAFSRIISGGTAARWPQWVLTGAVVALSPVPQAMDALTLAHGAAAHVIAPPPTLRIFLHELHWNVPVLCGAAGWLFAKWRGWAGPSQDSKDRLCSDRRLVALSARGAQCICLGERQQFVSRSLSLYHVARFGTHSDSGSRVLDTRPQVAFRCGYRGVGRPCLSGPLGSCSLSA